MLSPALAVDLDLDLALDLALVLSATTFWRRLEYATASSVVVAQAYLAVGALAEAAVAFVARHEKAAPPRRGDALAESMPPGTVLPAIAAGVDAARRRRQARLAVSRIPFIEPIADKREAFYQQRLLLAWKV